MYLDIKISKPIKFIYPLKKKKKLKIEIENIWLLLDAHQDVYNKDISRSMCNKNKA